MSKIRVGNTEMWERENRRKVLSGRLQWHANWPSERSTSPHFRGSSNPKHCHLLDRLGKWSRCTSRKGPSSSTAASQIPSHRCISGFSEPAAGGEEGGNFCKSHGFGPQWPGPRKLNSSYSGSSSFRTGTCMAHPLVPHYSLQQHLCKVTSIHAGTSVGDW